MFRYFRYRKFTQSKNISEKLLLIFANLCKSKINAKKIFKIINKHAISLSNYCFRIFKKNPIDFIRLDDDIRNIL